MGLPSNTLGSSRLFLSSSGAETPVYLASSPDPEGISGKYFSNCRERQPDAAAQDDEAAARLRRESERLIGL
jgi:hypothetical protein